MDLARILFIADTHLGFDLPLRPRIERRRRGHDFFANFERALQPALDGEVDLVVHGGDLLYRSRVPDVLVEQALAPLLSVAERSIPVYIVPGNHERSRIPLHLMTAHPLLHVFDEPRTYLCRLENGTLALSGFPFYRSARGQFPDLVAQTGYRQTTADVTLLCLHQAIEGAQVGVHNYTFRGGADVVRARDIPSDVTAVLSGHIHRSQVLKNDLQGRRMAAPVIYPGSIERTSFAEREEAKGYMLLRVGMPEDDRRPSVHSHFQPLPTRAMERLLLRPGSSDRTAVVQHLSKLLAGLPADAVVQVHVTGPHSDSAYRTLSAATLRRLAPSTMNISLAGHGAYARGRGRLA